MDGKYQYRLIFFAVFAIYSIGAIAYGLYYESKKLRPPLMGDYDKVKEYFVGYYRAKNKLPSAESELSEAVAQIVHSSHGQIRIDYAHEQVTYNFDGIGYDMHVSLPHIATLGLLDPRRSSAIGFDKNTIINNARLSSISQ